MILFSKRKHVIKKAVNKTVAAFADRTPVIYNHFFFGEYDIEPQKLAIWYLFETDKELETAKACGLCEEIEEKTVKNLISFGYPKEAFEVKKTSVLNDNIVVHDTAEEGMQKFFNSLATVKATVSFTSQEDIDVKSDGDFHLYFQ